LVPEGPSHSRQVVATGLQGLVAARLGRGFVPLAIAFVVGVVRLLTAAEGGFALPLGAVAAGSAMLAYGMRISQRAFGRPHRPWMSAAMLGSLVPPLFALYVLGWLGLRGLAIGEGAGAWAGGIGFAFLGGWAMRSWMKVVEVERLSQVMTVDLRGDS
jgi:hypothetical protein